MTERTLGWIDRQIALAVHCVGYIRLCAYASYLLSSLSRAILSLVGSLSIILMASISSVGSLPYSTRRFPSFSALKVVDLKRKRQQIVKGSFKESKSNVCCSKVFVDQHGWKGAGHNFERRKLLLVSSIGIFGNALSYFLSKEVALASEFADMPALRGKDYGKSKMRYPDYTETESGLQYKDLRVGEGLTPKRGDTVVVDWDGYTIGYYGRIFEARNKTKGGSFEGDDKEFFKFKLGSHEVIPAFEEALVGMAPGGIRRIVVPPELGYPDNDFNKLGPKPTNFSGQRALDFVLRNQGLIDKTLLFDIELLKVIPT